MSKTFQKFDLFANPMKLGTYDESTNKVKLPCLNKTKWL